MLQLLYADVLQKHHPELLLRWWNDALAYARHEAENGSHFAAECLRAYESSADRAPSRHHQVFHHFSFAYIGRRNEQGQFAHRHEFYSLSPEFYRAHQRYIMDYLAKLAEDLFEE